jgi:hypothetical protein
MKEVQILKNNEGNIWMLLSSLGKLGKRSRNPTLMESGGNCSYRILKDLKFL